MADEMPTQTDPEESASPDGAMEQAQAEEEVPVGGASEDAPENAPENAAELAEAADEAAEAVEDPEEPVVDQGPVSAEELDEARANEVAYSWQASEYVQHHKGFAWYATLGGVMVVLVALAVWLKLWLSIGAFLAMLAAIVVFARRPPRTLMYELTPKGITVDGKEYLYSGFRSFSVLKDLEWHTIDLEPVKRFSLPLSILFDNDDFDQIVGHLELHLPRADRDPDVIERVSRWARF